MKVGLMNDEDEIAIEGGEAKLIPPGRYEAKVLWYKHVRSFNRPMIQMKFRIEGLTPYQGTRLDAFLSLGPSGRARPRSKLARWYKTVSGNTKTRGNRISLKGFCGVLLLVEVRTVERDSRQKALSSENQYSVVDEIIGPIGLIKTKVKNEFSPDSHK